MDLAVGQQLFVRVNRICKSLLSAEAWFLEVFCVTNTQSYVAWHGWFTKVMQVLATVTLGLEISGHINQVCCRNYAYLPVM